MDYRMLAERALEKRGEIFEKRKAAAKAGKSDLCREFDAQMDSLAAEAREMVEFAETQNEIRGAVQRGGSLNSGAGNSGAEGDEWRALLPGMTEIRELRAEQGTEFIIPSGTAAKYVDMLRAKAVFLKGIPADNFLPFNDRKWTMPVLSDSDMPALVAENALITEGDDQWAGLEFDARKYADYRTVGNETLADSSVGLRNILADTMTKNCAVEFDADAFSGDGSTTPILGIVGQGVPTEVGSTAGDTATWDDVSDAVGRLWAANAEPTVIWADPTAATALAKEREGTEGARLEPNSPLNVARNLPILVSTNVPLGHVIVADGNRVFAGRREDARVAVSEHAEFQNDKTALRLTMRCAGVYAAESSSVQVLTPNSGA
jgi:HK97 family phage major capsid protein